MPTASSLFIGFEVIGMLLAIAICLYGGYWAFSIRHALFVRTFRSQALWLGFFSIYLIPHILALDSIVNSLNSPIAYFANESYYIFLAVLLFRLIDIDVGLARRSDPLLRQTLHWKQLRLVIWSIMTISIASLIVLAIADIFGYSTPMSSLVPLQATVYLSFLIPGASALIIGAGRSRDEAFRRSLKWYGLFFLALLIDTIPYFLGSSGLVSISPDTMDLTSGYAFVPAAYCLYRSARSLAPMGKIPPSE